MESCMDVDAARQLKRKTPINLLTGILLKTVHFLDADLTKFVTVGIFKDRGDSLGVLFKSKKSYTFWSYITFNQFAVHFNNITEAFQNKSKLKVQLDTGEDVILKQVFGNYHLALYDGERTVTLTHAEWKQFITNLPLINSHLSLMFEHEEDIKTFIRDLFCGDEEKVNFVDVPCNLTNKLYEEVTILKKHESSC